MSAPGTRLSLLKGRPPVPVSVGAAFPFVPDAAPIEQAFAIGERVVFQRRFRATVAGFAADGVSLSVESTSVPDVSEVLAGDARSFLPLKCCFGFLGIRSKFYRVVNRILGSVMVDGVNCGFGAVRQLRERGLCVRVARLGLVRLEPRPDGFQDVFVAPRMRDAVAEWCRRAPRIPALLERDAAVTAKAAFEGRPDAAVALREWVEGLFPDALFPFVEYTRSHTGMDLIAKRFARVPRIVVKRTAKPGELLRIGHCLEGTEVIDWARPVMSIAQDESFGCTGYVVGFSQMTRTAAVLFMSESEGFSDFGCGTIGAKIGKVVSLDAILQL
jgi:hypothetical protein